MNRPTFAAIALVIGAGFGTAASSASLEHAPLRDRAKRVKVSVAESQPLLSATIHTPATAFAVPSSAKALVPEGMIRRRQPQFELVSARVPRVVFDKPPADATGRRLREAAQQFFSRLSPAFSPTALRESVMQQGTDLLRLSLPGDTDIAYAVPQSGTFSLIHNDAPDRDSVIRSPEAAVSAALDAVAGLLKLAPNESLDIVGIGALHHSETDGKVSSPARVVAHNVLFGRAYKGIPVLGPSVLVILDPDGKMMHFRKAWRDIAGENGEVEVASPSTLEARRDGLMAKYLSVTTKACGYSEDTDPTASQPVAGLACRYAYEDSRAESPMVRRPEDWVNAAADATLPMRGSRTVGAASP